MIRPVLILDRTHAALEGDVLEHFALDELLCRYTGEGGPAVCHLWRHAGSFVMGSRDSRLPQTGTAVRALHASGIDAVVRHSGGAAVPLDAGVINVSLILPIPGVSHRQDFRQDFQRMVSLIQRAVVQACRAAGAEEAEVAAGEIEGAFCPGDYDLSVGGRKFCGIAQRRQRKAFIIQAFVIVEGSGSARARLVRSFYDTAAAGADPGQYPLVIPEYTASLEELTGLGSGKAAIARFIEGVKQVISAGNAEQVTNADAVELILADKARIKETAAKLRQRYELP
ncbi:lipoate--protein ligase family protein [Paenibacillus antibioticophila]|uniref:lipoate--protein ligase family protein n=1 Tax=Paenibacillus antibioticophila TaxID=1274374 RepID=UPI0009DBB369|nr:biotin/lipoate A/B protein ligase family protein [Paenibacillus antibioticophila]